MRRQEDRHPLLLVQLLHMLPELVPGLRIHQMP
jgi:hypothetical protein